MRDITPKDMRCWPTHCPTIFEVTPEDMACEVVSCPSVFAVEPVAEAEACGIGSCPAILEGPWNNEEGYFLVGKIVPDAQIPDAVKAKVGEDEAAIWVPQKLLKGNEALK